MTYQDIPIKECSLCHKKVQDINVLVEVAIETYARYRREDNLFEDMNGLWKKVSEHFCESCFKNFVSAIESLYSTQRTAAQTDKQEIPVSGPATAGN